MAQILYYKYVLTLHFQPLSLYDQIDWKKFCTKEKEKSLSKHDFLHILNKPDCLIRYLSE